MKFKSLMSGILSVVLLVTFVTMASANVFPDVLDKHSWAEEAINDMVDRAILKGFPDGTFKPDNGITKLDALIIAARIAGVDEDENIDFADAAYEAYEETLEEYSISYKYEVAYLLYKNILEESDLPDYIADDVKASALKRHEAAILLVKMMGAEKEAQEVAGYSTNYADLNDIPKASLPYVNYVNKVGVMKGMEDNKFMPYYEVSRAMMATMMHRAEKVLTDDIYEAYVNSVSPSYSSIEATYNDKDFTLELTEDTLIRIDGYDAEINHIVPGFTLKVTERDGKVYMIEGLSSAVSYKTSGTVVTVASQEGNKILTITPTGETEDVKQSFPLSNSVVVKIDNKETVISNIKTGNYVKLEIVGGQVIEIVSETKATKYTGTINSVKVDEATVIEVELSDGEIMEFVINSDAEVKRNNKDIDPWLLSEGDSVTLTVKTGIVTVLNATSKSSTTEGTITGINICKEPTITMNIGGKEKTYSVNSETQFVVDDKDDATIYDLRLSANATIKLESNTIAKISTQKVASSPVLVGTISYIHPTSYVMGIDVDGETVQAVVKSTVKITDATASKITSFKGLKAGRGIVAVGTMNYGVFEVTSITITY